MGVLVLSGCRVAATREQQAICSSAIGKAGSCKPHGSRYADGSHHGRRSSFQTRRRYYEAMKRFCRFLAKTYHLERLANIAPKHIYAYTAFMQAQGKSAATIKTDLAAIRFFHDQMPNPRYRLPDNSVLDLERRSFGKADRTWSNEAFNRMLGKALALGRCDYILAFYLARYAVSRSLGHNRADVTNVYLASVKKQNKT